MASDDQIEEILSGIADAYPHLRVEQEVQDGTLTLAGPFPVRHENRDVDRFYVRMQVPLDFPQQWPVVWETAGRIPRIMDRHVYADSGSLCVMLPDEAYLALSPGITLLEYLNGPVQNYFLGQLCVEQGKPWPWGEHEHGLPAAIKFYGEFLALDDERAIIAVLYRVWEGRYKGHWPCPCRSGLITRKCHGHHMGQLRERIPESQLTNVLSRYAHAQDASK